MATLQPRRAAGIPAGGQFAARDRDDDTMTLCASSGKPVMSWSAKTPWPPVENIHWGDGTAHGTLTCGRCQQAVVVRRQFGKGVKDVHWRYDDHFRGR